MNFVENIRRIGVFMIAAQTVMHFAAGKQYERYIKMITGVILLLMFVGPFVSSPVSQAADWKGEIERMEKQIQRNMQREVSYVSNSAETAALRQIEEEVRAMLNDTVSDMDCSVADVTIDLEEIDTSDASSGNNSHNWEFQKVRITLQRMETADDSDENEVKTIRIEEITVGIGTETDNQQQNTQDLGWNTKMQEYRRLFAQTLGIADDKVEVTYRGGW